MSEKQETVMDVCYFADKEISTLGTNGWKNVIDRIFSAHNREIAEKDAEIARLKRVIDQMDTNCNRLKERIALLEKALKSSCRWIKCHDIYHTSGVDILKEAKELLQDDGEFLFKENK